MTVIGDATIKFVRPTYEYEVIDRSEHDVGRGELAEELNQLGKRGWLYVGDHRDMCVLVRPLAPPPTRQAVTGTVSVVAATSSEGETMALTVDTAGVAKFVFDDDKGDVVGAPKGDGTGVTVSFSSDNPAVVSGFGPTQVGTDANGNPEYTATPTVVADGSYNLTAVVSNTSGAPLVDDDGATPFVQPASVPVTLAGGQATTGTTSEG
jgi:hypothetical protein